MIRDGAEGRMKLTILGGFLGSGKTTWLRHQLHADAFGEALVIVNEAAAVPVDDALLYRSSRLAVLPDGCACCAGKEGFLRLMRGIAEDRVDGNGTRGARLEQLVLETSGLADPGPIVDALRSDPVLVHHVVVGEIVVAVDALNGLVQMRGEPLSRRQVETADRLVVTKVDMADQAELKRLLATLRQLNPGAAIAGAALGSTAALPDYADAVAEPLPDLSGRPQAPVIATTLHVDPAIDWTTFSTWMSALLHARGDDILRVKGVVPTPAGRLLLQGVRRVVQPPEILPGGAANVGGTDNEIVVIGRSFDPADLPRSLRRFVEIAS